MSFGLFRMCIRGDCVIDMTNKRLIRNFAPGGKISVLFILLHILRYFKLQLAACRVPTHERLMLSRFHANVQIMSMSYTFYHY